MSKLECCRLKCGEQFTDNWYGKSKVLPLANHDSRSFFNRQFSAIWFAEHCDMKSALLCLTCASNLKSWFELEWGSIASDSYGVSFDGRSAAIIYRSFESAGDSQTSLSELRVSSDDGFLNKFVVRCFVSGVLVSPQRFLEGQGYNFEDDAMDFEREMRSSPRGDGQSPHKGGVKRVSGRSLRTKRLHHRYPSQHEIPHSSAFGGRGSSGGDGTQYPADL